MENPDVELEVNRNNEGQVIAIRYKVNNREPEGRPIIEFLEAIAIMWADRIAAEHLEQSLENISVKKGGK